jgi:hypothetical protein
VVNPSNKSASIKGNGIFVLAQAQGLGASGKKNKNKKNTM